MHIRYYPARIEEIRDETPDAFSLVLHNPDPVVFRYQAGQYLTLKVQTAGDTLRRAFSLSSSPATDRYLRITIKRLPGGRVSNYLRDHLRPGDSIEVLPPMGNFTFSPLPERSRCYVLIGAGSGITPLFSILKTILSNEPLSRVRLWYGNRDQDSIIFAEELTRLGRTYGDRLHVHHTLSQPQPGWKGYTGRLDTQRIYDLLSELFMEDELRKTYYVCGPEGLMDAAERAFDKHAVHPGDVLRERYAAPAPTEAEVERAYQERNATQADEESELSDGTQTYVLQHRQVEVVLYGQSHRIDVAPNQYVLDAALDAGLDPPFACQSGICTTCRGLLRKGTVAMDETEGLSAAELQAGYILTCQSHPLDDDVAIEYK
ncbi:MAG: phenylacetate-CoA oxygenase/reductase subunit PaaK [Bacteroidia bacterium]